MKLKAHVNVQTAEVSLKDALGHHWIRLFVSWTGKCEPGRKWLYAGMVRRDAWRVGPLGFGLMRMPKNLLKEKKERVRDGVGDDRSGST